MEQLQLELAVVQSKICSKCNIEQNLSNFNKDAKGKGGISSKCKSCCKEYKKDYYIHNKEKVTAANKEYVIANKEKVRQRKKEWANKNQDKLKEVRAIKYKERVEKCPEYNSLQYQKHRDKRIAYQKEYTKNNPEKIKARRQEYEKNNKDIIRERRILYREKNKEIIKEKQANYYAENIDRIKEKCMIYRKNNQEQLSMQQRRWRESHPERMNESRRNNKAQRKKAEGTHTHQDIINLFRQQNGLCAGCGSILITSGKQKYHIDHIVPMCRGGVNYAYNLQLLCQGCNLSKGIKTQEEWDEYKNKISVICQSS